jgi:hypothetical protein
LKNLSTKSTSSFSVNVPASLLYSKNLVSIPSNMSRIEEIDRALERIFAIESHLSMTDCIQVSNMQIQIEKIMQKYRDNDREMIPLDEMRIAQFQERIEEIYIKNEPSSQDLIYAELLMQEKKTLLENL